MGCSESHQNYGYRIYSLIPDSPLHLAGLRPLEDFIIPEQEMKNISLKDYVDRFSEAIEFNVYNLRGRNFRKVTVDIKNKPYLGAIVNYEDYIAAKSNLLHVYKVKFNTHAEEIGLVSDEDYIIGIKDKYDDLYSLNSELKDPLALFYENVTPECILYVYNRTSGPKELRCEHESLGCDAVFGPGHEFPDDKRRIRKVKTGYYEYSNLTNESDSR